MGRGASQVSPSSFECASIRTKSFTPRADWTTNEQINSPVLVRTARGPAAAADVVPGLHSNTNPRLMLSNFIRLWLGRFPAHAAVFKSRQWHSPDFFCPEFRRLGNRDGWYTNNQDDFNDPLRKSRSRFFRADPAATNSPESKSNQRVFPPMERLAV
jgi:hypothetical protein